MDISAPCVWAWRGNEVVGLCGLHPQSLPLEMAKGGGGLAHGSILAPWVHPLSYGVGQAMVVGCWLSSCWGQVAVRDGPGLVFFFSSTTTITTKT